jgi:hypothetical protein
LLPPQVVNGNPLLPTQWTAVVMVFTGLIASTLLKARGHKGKHKAKKESTGSSHSNGHAAAKGRPGKGKNT